MVSGVRIGVVHSLDEPGNFEESRAMATQVNLTYLLFTALYAFFSLLKKKKT